jgi:hypothetical protein
MLNLALVYMLPMNKFCMSFFSVGRLQVFTAVYSGVGFANTNAKVNTGTTAKLCAIFASDQATWRNSINKVSFDSFYVYFRAHEILQFFIPESLVGDSADAGAKAQFENNRLAYMTQVSPGVDATSAVRFSLLDRTGSK